MITFNHFNFNVLNLERSIAFYSETLGLTQVREINHPEGAFKIVYLSDGDSLFTLELTWLKDRTQPYNLGECEFHLAFQTDEFDTMLEKHRALGCVCYENPDMGIYFIQDPDGYWVEVVPVK